MNFNLTASFFEEFDFMFHGMLRQRGSKLMPIIPEVPVNGEMRSIRQYNMGEPYFVETAGAPTMYSNMDFDRRILIPRAFKFPLTFDPFDLIRQGSPDVGQFAQEASDACGELIDKIIIGGIAGKARTSMNGDVILPAKQYIKYTETPYTSETSTEIAEDVRKGFNVGKLSKAVEMLTAAHNNAMIACVLSNRAQSQLLSDPRVASSIFNYSGPALSQWQMAPYAGCSMFITSENVAKNVKTMKTNDDKKVEHVYLFAVDKIKLGCSLPLTMDTGKNAERGLSDVIIYRGMYDCVRMQEESVVVVEIPAA